MSRWPTDAYFRSRGTTPCRVPPTLATPRKTATRTMSTPIASAGHSTASRRFACSTAEADAAGTAAAFPSGEYLCHTRAAASPEPPALHHAAIAITMRAAIGAPHGESRSRKAPTRPRATRNVTLFSMNSVETSATMSAYPQVLLLSKVAPAAPASSAQPKASSAVGIFSLMPPAMTIAAPAPQVMLSSAADVLLSFARRFASQ